MIPFFFMLVQMSRLVILRSKSINQGDTMSLEKYCRGERVHQRHILINTYSYEGETEAVVLEGKLLEDRLQHYYLTTGEKRDPGPLHHMTIRMLVKGADLEIGEIEVEMNEVPREECGETAAFMEKVRGMKIGPGFSKKIRDMLGGVKGCAHLVALLLAMAPAAVQGFWAYRARKPVSGEFKEGGRMMKYLENTCYVWRSDGPMMERLRKMNGYT